MEKTLRNFKYQIDHDDFEAKIDYEKDMSFDEKNNDNTVGSALENFDFDDTKSYSTISISKEYDLINDDKSKLNENIKATTKDRNESNDASDFVVDSGDYKQHYSVSSDEFSSSSSVALKRDKIKISHDLIESNRSKTSSKKRSQHFKKPNSVQYDLPEKTNKLKSKI